MEGFALIFAVISYFYLKKRTNNNLKKLNDVVAINNEILARLHQVERNFYVGDCDDSN